MTRPRSHGPVAGMNRREFLKRTAVSSLVSARVAGGGAAAPGAPPASTNNIEWYAAPCRLCGVGCGLLVGIENGRAVAAKGDPDSPVSRGWPCVKGYHSTQSLYGSDRLTRALVRRAGVLRPTPIDAAFDLVAERLRGTIARHGKDSVAVYGSAQWTLTDAHIAAVFARDVVGTRYFDTSARLDGASAAAARIAAFGRPDVPGCHEDIDHADVIVLWDANLSETNPVLFSRMVERRRANPAVKIIDLSTRATRTSYAADRSLRFVPGAELAIANALCHEVVRRRWVNRDFINRFAAVKKASGRALDGAADATWREYVASVAAYTPESVQRASGLPADDLTWLASLYGDRTRRVVSVWDATLNTRPAAVGVNIAIYNLHLLLGRIASPGNGAFSADTHSGIGHTAPDQSTDALSIFRAIEQGDIRFLWIQATNPMVSLPNADRYRRAIVRNHPFVVVSELYPTATTEIADVVLPAAGWLERDGALVNNEHRVQRFQRLVRAPGDALPDGWQFIEVSRRLGHAQRFPAEVSTYEQRIAAPARPDARWLFNPGHDPAADRRRGTHDFYGHADHRAWIWLSSAQPAVERVDADFPFALDVGPVLEHSGTGTLTRRIPTLRRAAPAAYVEFNRQDAETLGIRDGDAVRVTSRRGSITATARLERRSQPQRGRVFIPTFDDAVRVSTLLPDTCSAVSGQPESGACAVRIARIGRAGGSGDE